MFSYNELYLKIDLKFFWGGVVSKLKLNQVLKIQLDKLIDTRNSVVISQDLFFSTFCFYK